MRHLRLICCGLLGLALAACEKSEPPAKQSSTVVSSSGGKVTNGGSSVTIPAGALPGSTTITDTATPDAPLPSHATALGTAYTFGPEGQQFTVPVTVTLEFDPSKLPAGRTTASVVVFTAPAGSSSFTSIGGMLVDATHIAAQTTHFSTFLPGIADPPTGCSVCAEGRCSSYCPQGETACGSSCVDTSHDSQNCGACGQACPSDQGCLGGSCVPSCGGFASSGCAMSGGGCCPGEIMCNGTCTDPTSDSQNCGGCGSACGNAEMCVNSVCTPVCAGGALCFNGLCASGCPTGTTTCGGGCVDTSSDSQNCGACGHSCGASETCAQGACVHSCGTNTEVGCGGGPASADGGFTCCSGYTSCGGDSCADLQNDPLNCGGCGTTCESGQVCTAGTCGPQCPGDAFCYGGACLSSCPSGTVSCAGSCADTQNDSANCGACGAQCPEAQACLAGTCVAVCGESSPSDGGISFAADGGPASGG